MIVNCRSPEMTMLVNNKYMTKGTYIYMFQKLKQYIPFGYFQLSILVNISHDTYNVCMFILLLIKLVVYQGTSDEKCYCTNHKL